MKVNVVAGARRVSAFEKIIPDAVTRNEQGYLLVNNDPILWAMLNAIKEQQRQIEELKKIIFMHKSAGDKRSRHAQRRSQRRRVQVNLRS